MRSAVSPVFLLVLGVVHATAYAAGASPLGASAASFSYEIAGADRGAWPEALESLGLRDSGAGQGNIIVVPAGAIIEDRAAIESRVKTGAILILEGDSPLANAFGIHATPAQVTIRSIVDARAPKLPMVWEDAVSAPRFELPKTAWVFAEERWEHAPVLAGFRHGSGAVVWLATGLGSRGYSRYPYLPQAMADLGFTAPFRSARLWAFFDSSYRSRVDLDYIAPRWRAAGISALHVAAWHYWEPDAERDAYLKKLIEACHRNAIQVYAWLELPHVSDRFWADHPEWREKTAIGQDAQLDWRKLMNLTNRDAFNAVTFGLRELAGRFDWDGLNLAELYFESLEGHENPSRFTPLNRDVRVEFRKQHGFDPVDVFSPASPRYAAKSPDSLNLFLEYRAELARRQQTEWIAEVEKIRQSKPWLDLTLTHVDDRLDATMRAKIGADTSKTLPLLASHDFTFLIEDPATTWNLGPQRYTQIAARYQDVTPRPEKLAVDINIVERYQDVYPTKQQTGLELFQLVHASTAAFPRVALYFENSILPPDLALLPAAAADVELAGHSGGKLIVDSKRGAGVAWKGAANVDGRPWPVRDANTVWLPSGTHAIEPATAEPALRITDLNADLLSAKALPDGVEFVYSSQARAFVILEHDPSHNVAHVEIDGEAAKGIAEGLVLTLPRGQHLVTVRLDPGTRSAR